jgi:hypothetical protein
MDEAISLEGVKVAIGMPVLHGVGIPIDTALSLAETMLHCADINPAVLTAIGPLTWARDDIVTRFLDGGFTKLFWIDSDIVWGPDDFKRMLALSTKEDVVCATYPAKVDGPMTAYIDQLPEPEHGPNGLVTIKGVGLGFTIMDRKVLEALVKTKRKLKDSISGKVRWDIFRWDAIPGDDGFDIPRGEDMAFFADIRALGFKVWFDGSIGLGHVGTRIWRAKGVNNG